MYRGATNQCPWPNMDCIRDNDINNSAKSVEDGIEYLDPARMSVKAGISTFNKTANIPAVTGGWYEYPEETPTNIPGGLCVVAGNGGHWAWQPQIRMSVEAFKHLLILTHPKFRRVN